jgi:hypothetical protein
MAVAACGPSAPPSIDLASARRLPAGEVVGFTGPYGSHVWRGIPYAAHDGPRLLGAAHGLVAPFVFGHFDLGPDTHFIFGRGSREGREMLASQMMSYCAEFAYSGAPGRGRNGDLPEWTAWNPDPAGPKYLVLDTPEGGGLRMASETLTVERAVAGLLADPRFVEARRRCAVLVEWRCVTREQYSSGASAYALRAGPGRGWDTLSAREV